MEILSPELNQILIRSEVPRSTLTSPRFPPFFRLHVRSRKLSVNRSRRVGHLVAFVGSDLFLPRSTTRRSIKNRDYSLIGLYIETDNAAQRVNSGPAPSSELEGGFQPYTLCVNLIPRGLSHDALKRTC